MIKTIKAKGREEQKKIKGRAVGKYDRPLLSTVPLFHSFNYTKFVNLSQEAGDPPSNRSPGGQ